MQKKAKAVRPRPPRRSALLDAQARSLQTMRREQRNTKTIIRLTGQLDRLRKKADIAVSRFALDVLRDAGFTISGGGSHALGLLGSDASLFEESAAAPAGETK